MRCADCRAEYSHAYYLANHNDEWRAKRVARAAAIKADTQRYARERAARLDWRRQYRQAVLDAYGGECACCGETTYEFLAIDHVNNDGKLHEQRNGVRAGFALIRWLKKHNFPQGFQVLCHNCNCAKAWYGICPHQADTED